MSEPDEVAVIAAVVGLGIAAAVLAVCVEHPSKIQAGLDDLHSIYDNQRQQKYLQGGV